MQFIPHRGHGRCPTSCAVCCGKKVLLVFSDSQPLSFFFLYKCILCMYCLQRVYMQPAESICHCSHFNRNVTVDSLAKINATAVDGRRSWNSRSVRSPVTAVLRPSSTDHLVLILAACIQPSVVSCSLSRRMAQ